MDIVEVGFIVDGVKDLFPGADKQALRCCAELMDKDRKALTAENAALRARVAELEGALRPMAEVASDIPDDWPDGHQCVTSIDHFRRARATLKGETP